MRTTLDPNTNIFNTDDGPQRGERMYCLKCITTFLERDCSCLDISLILSRVRCVYELDSCTLSSSVKLQQFGSRTHNINVMRYCIVQCALRMHYAAWMQVCSVLEMLYKDIINKVCWNSRKWRQPTVLDNGINLNFHYDQFHSTKLFFHFFMRGIFLS